jgi:hypothetical protein
MEELRFSTELTFVTKVLYHAPLDRGMTEHEIVSVFTGRYQGPIDPDPAEADAVRWIEPAALKADLEAKRYTVWFRKYVTHAQRGVRRRAGKGRMIRLCENVVVRQVEKERYTVWFRKYVTELWRPATLNAG